MNIINDYISRYTNLIILIMMIMVFIIFILTIVNGLKTTKLKKRYEKVINQVSDKKLEEILLDYYKKVERVLKENKEINDKINKVNHNMEQCAQKIGVVRYNAFKDVGSDLSFSIAVLDKNDNGLVINGIYSRENSTVYTKPIEEGKSKYTLSSEEEQSLELAKRNYNEKVIV